VHIKLDADHAAWSSRPDIPHAYPPFGTAAGPVGLI